ncbi:protein of unknown function [Candidatus Nitrosacidococcus tergens]|uniref:Transposase n=1 Tax=Candidatus Nitrosacidococcus tergens TaxID=553981 RepID=A0A7G1QBG9_9GAMM|nr:protein of unknown function [Candidatus Nitrosacidococcus tergens]
MRSILTLFFDHLEVRQSLGLFVKIAIIYMAKGTEYDKEV